MGKKSKIALLSIFSILVILFFGVIPWYFSSLVFYPKVNCNREHHVYCNPDELKLQYETVELKTEDGISLDAWYIPSGKSEKGILVVHGHGGSKPEGLRLATALNKSGFNLLLISLRRNHGSFASMGFHEQKDAKAGFEYLVSSKKLKSIGILGFSMGSATSILYMAGDPRVKAGLFSSGYSNAVAVLSEAAKRDYKVPKYPLIPTVEFYLNLRGNMDIGSVRPIDKIGSISPRPISIMHCDQDNYVEGHHAELLFNAAKEPKTKWIPKCTQHERLWNRYPKETEKWAVDFFKRNL